jgi:hypothetical protein
MRSTPLGVRTVFSTGAGASPVGGGDPFSQLYGIALGSFSDLFVVDVNTAAKDARIVRIDSISGNRILVSGSALGTGPLPVAPRHLVFQPGASSVSPSQWQLYQ